jgi:hypothetical protein
MLGTAIHRLVEQQAATRGNATAYADGAQAVTYRDLNCRANTVARALILHGLRRGDVAMVRMERSPELLVTLLAVLKAGGAYMWAGTETSWPAGVSIAGGSAGREQKCLAVDLSRVFTEEARPSPNLPILTRPSDIACVLGEVLVPHATVVGLRDRPVPSNVPWPSENSALDVWLALMKGATLSCTQPQPATAAA